MIRVESQSIDAEASVPFAAFGKKLVDFRKKQLVCAQGELASALFYVQSGQIKLTVLSAEGKEATLTLLGSGDFVGESCLGPDGSLHTASAEALTDYSAIRIERKLVFDMLQCRPEFARLLVAYLVARNHCAQDDLVNHLFNSAEKRLARILLSLARFGKNDNAELILPRISQETLAEMVGTSRSRVNIFMNRFRRQGLVQYDNELEVRVHRSRMHELLQE
jgi:CRP/FNR family cyclic AMP-dependent transcriptional regulator